MIMIMITTIVSVISAMIVGVVAELVGYSNNISVILAVQVYVFVFLLFEINEIKSNSLREIKN